MRLGTIRCSRSVAETATSVAQKNAATNDFPGQPNARNEAAISSAVSELDGRIDDADRVAAALALPRRASQERSGMLSYQASSGRSSCTPSPGPTIERLQRHACGDDVEEAADREPGDENDGGEGEVHRGFNRQGAPRA